MEDVIFEVSREEYCGGLSLQLSKDMDLSLILGVISGSALTINSVNTREPSLEDAFLSITRGGTD